MREMRQRDERDVERDERDGLGMGVERLGEM